MPSSCRRTSAAARRASRIRSPALSWATRSVIESHSGVAYSGCEPTSRYSRAPFSRNTFEDLPQCTTRRNRYRATSSGERRRWPRNVQVTPYSFSKPKILRSTSMSVGPRGTNAGMRLAGQDPRHLVVGEAAELPALGPGPVQDTGLDRRGLDLAALGAGERLHGFLHGGGQVPAFLKRPLEGLGQGVGVAADPDEPVLVGDGPVEQDVVDLVASVVARYLRHQDLHLVRLHLLGEDGGQGLGIPVGDVSGPDVLPPVRVPPEIGEAHAGDPQVLELAVLPHPGEGDPVVDLRDLVQRGAWVLRDEQDPVRVLEAHHRLAPGDALVGEVRAVLHELLGRRTA